MAALALAGCGLARPVFTAPLVQAVPTAVRYPQFDQAELIPALPPPPTPAPAQLLPALAPSFAPVAPPPVTPIGEPGRANRLFSSDGSLNVAVGSYTDCSGVSPISRARADLDPCFQGRYYFVGHNPGVFSPLLKLHAGAEITWIDANGNANRFRVIAERDFRRNSGPLSLARPDVAAQFQTCLTLDGSLDRILDAVRI